MASSFKVALSLLSDSKLRDEISREIRRAIGRGLLRALNFVTGASKLNICAPDALSLVSAPRRAVELKACKQSRLSEADDSRTVMFQWDQYCLVVGINFLPKAGRHFMCLLPFKSSRQLFHIQRTSSYIFYWNSLPAETFAKNCVVTTVPVLNKK
mmetsp:Transcript_10346/g.18845  ORF Transcript_10346/g.18845 Transcript_10346/m.18845 type:complete len:155 (+) Transcript_10346:4474-4938(+)